MAIVIQGIGIDSIPLNVRDYGASGDGVADDTAAIQAAVDAAVVTGSQVYFPPGNYLTDTISLHPHSFLYGAGREVTWIKARSNSETVFNYVASAFVTGFTFRDMTIDANSKTSVTLIKIDGTDSAKRVAGVLIEDVTFWGTATKAVWLRFCAGTIISRCISELPVDAFTIDNCADTNIDNTFALLGTGVGFRILGTGGATPSDEGTRLVNCVTNGQAWGLWLDTVDWGSAVGCSFTTCSGGSIYMEDSTNWSFYAVEIAAAASAVGLWAVGTCANITMSGCKVAVNSFGIIATGSGWTITGNTFFSNSNVDIYLGDFTHGTVVGNSCQSSGVATSISANGTIVGVACVGNSTNGTVSGFSGDDVAANNIVW